MQCILPNSVVKDFNVGQNDEAAAYRGISFLVLSGKLKGA